MKTPLRKEMPIMRLLGIFLLFVTVGCANQATVVELEDYTEKLKIHQRDLQQRIEFLEGQSDTPSVHVKTQQDFTAALVAQLSDIEALVREFTGRVDKTEHQVSTLNNKVDSESFRTKTLLDRLAKLEKKLAALKKADSSVDEIKKENPPNPPRPLGLRKENSPTGSTGLSPTEAYNLAYNDYLKGNYHFAISAFDAFIKQYPESILIPQAYYWKGEIFYSEKSYWKAIAAFKYVIQHYPKSEKISKALLKTGFAFFELKRPEKAKSFLEKILEQFPHSNESSLAEDKLASFN